MSTIEKANEKLLKTISSLAEPSPITRRNPFPDNNDQPSINNADNSDSQHQVTAQSVTLDREKMHLSGLLLPDMGNTRIAEQYRKIKHPLLRKIDAKISTTSRDNLIMVSSAVEGEGKSYTAINLAISIAMELDHTALLIDIDSKKNSLSKLLGITTQTGLTDYLGSTVPIEKILYSTDIAKFKIIPSGKFELASPEAITSIKMKDFLTEISNRYPDRVIVLDTPPLLASAISKALAYMVGQVLMVVEAEKTPMSVVEEAVQHINPERFAGFILNKTNLASSAESLYGGYE